MKTEFSKFEIASIKRTAQNCSGMIAKFEKLNEKIAILQAERDKVEQMINNWDAPIVAMTGHHVMDLVVRERVKTGVDKNGNDIYGSKWVLKYPETVIPVKVIINPAMEEIPTGDKVEQPEPQLVPTEEEEEAMQEIAEEATKEEPAEEILDDEDIKF